MYNNYLMHYGILGMHWGIRRGSSVSSSRPKKRKVYLPREAKYLDDKELQRRVTRLNNERQYRKMTQSRAANAHDAVNKILATATTAAVTAYATTKVAKALRETFG